MKYDTLEQRARMSRLLIFVILLMAATVTGGLIALWPTGAIDAVEKFQALIAGDLALVAGALAFFAAHDTFRANRALEAERAAGETKAIASAFLGEISGLLGLIRRRNMLAIYQNQMSLLKSGQTSLLMTFLIKSDYFTVWHTNAPKLGALPAPVPERIAGFYIHAKGINDTLLNFADRGNRAVPFDAKELEKSLEFMIEELLAIEVIGDHLISVLDTVQAGLPLPTDA